jgi:LysM repeat protein
MLDAFQANNNQGGDGTESNDGTDFSSLLTTPNLLAAGLFFTAIILFIAVVRTRGNQRSRSKSWELQEATWGIQDDQGWGDSTPASSPPVAPPTQPAPAAPAANMYAPEQQDIYGRPAYQASQPVMQPAQNNDLLSDLGAAPSKPANTIDTSFLDDLL